MTRYRQRTHNNNNNKYNNSTNNYHRQHLNSTDLDNQYSLNEENNKYFESELNGYLFSFLHIDGINEFSFFPSQKINNFLFQQLIFSRLIILLFQCTINFVMRDGPTDAFKGINQPENNKGSSFDLFIYSIFGGLTTWDARHFLHIAEFGYIWESSLAFFPLFPISLRILGGFLYLFIGNWFSLFSSMLIAGILLNNILFVINGMILFRLTLFLNGGNIKEAILAVYIHCWCPASIFYSSLYSESLYSTFTFLGLLLLYSPTTSQSRLNLLYASAIFSLAFLTRSNGLANIGFIGFYLLLDSIIFIGRQIPNENGGDGGGDKNEIQKYQQLEFREFSFDLIKRFFTNFLFGLLCFALMSIPLRVFEFSVHDKFCTLSNVQYNDLRIKNYFNSEEAIFREIVLPGELTKLEWCNESFSFTNNFLLPNYYQFIQQKYWDVGLFNYWKWQKLPLFLLAAPTLWIAIYGFIKQTFQLLSTDLRPIPEILIDRNSQIPFACHILLLALSGLFFYNVEVSIRLLYSSSPFLYLVLARLINNQTLEQQKIDDLLHSKVLPFLRDYMRKGFWPFLIFCYLFGYFIFGTMLHVNWLPFV
ncbi:hypothetical protein ACQ4LE_003914 [Meloidogyne hapla]|uniref:GPI mannosyltransferase 2 n=1 Tax=Meloidogyne hapla TaxID=6305 RepID=A0A1I8B6W3_MELHA